MRVTSAGRPTPSLATSARRRDRRAGAAIEASWRPGLSAGLGVVYSDLEDVAADADEAVVCVQKGEQHPVNRVAWEAVGLAGGNGE